MSVSSAGARQNVTQLVVIGASAGGIEALLTLIGSLPAEFPAPIVIAQHLDPRRPSQLAALMSGRSHLPVHSIEGEEPLLPGTVYVVPADRDVEITDHHVTLLTHAGRGSKPSIDYLLTSAAHRFGEGLIAVILTGTGTDGAAGAQAVKAYGGAVVIQNPETARFPGMPLAVAPSAVDVVANLEAIGPLLMELLSNSPARPAAQDEEDLRPFLDRLREQTGLDFLAYKRPTIERRLHRRMTAVGVDSIAEYRRYIDGQPDEVQRLVANFLIKVTEFFRDPEVFTYLSEQVLPELIAEARTRGELRIWSAGCATGEEAYSLAMLVADALGDELGSLPVRIFATDVSPDAVEFARRGIYPESALADVAPDVRARHFLKVDGGYEVRKAVRSMVIFGEHDLGYRAPFPRIDLVLCRNVLIYFTPELQRRALQRFVFALRRGGYLVLGKSETVSPLPEFFSLEHGRLKVFRRVGEGLPVSSDPFVTSGSLAGLGERSTRRALARPPIAARFQAPHSAMAPHGAEALLDAVSVGVVAVDWRYDVIAINVAARQHLGLQTPAMGEDLIHAVGATFREPLRQVVDAALRGERTSLVYPLPPDPIEGVRRDLLIVGAPYQAFRESEAPEAALIQISDISALAQRQRELEAGQSQLAAAVDEVRALRSANQRMASEQGRLRGEVEGLQVAQEEALAAAEEIETLHEEQQATNEELETVNEELQATVEELQATVGELHARTAELEAMTESLEAQRQETEVERSRLAAILTNMGDAILVVDASSNTVLANATYERLFGQSTEFTPQDESGIPLPADVWPRERAARGEAFTLAFTSIDPNGVRRWFESSAQPVRGNDDEQWGVLVIRDITDRSLRRQQEQFVAIAAHELRNPLAALSGRLQLLLRRLDSTADTADQRLRQDAERALEQARRLEGYIHELLDATRIQFGQLSLDHEPVELAALLRGVVELVQPQTTAQMFDLRLAVEPVVIEGDGHRLEQVLLNLLNNAITYAAESERIEVRLTTSDGFARIDVEDHGPGIAPDALPHIFERFVQAGTVHTNPHSLSGLGLGLFIAKQIVTAHGGTIQARSTLNEGTTLTVQLPLRSESDPAPTP